MPRKIEIPKRFASKWTPEPNTGCWLWFGTTVGGPRVKVLYGQFWIGDRQYQAHRVSYDLHVGRIPDGLCVLHRCDNPACVNPDHLFLGTQADNVHDMHSKGRLGNSAPKNPAAGERSPRALLNDLAVVDIRARFKPRGMGGNARTLAFEYGVSVDLIHKVVARKCWRHIAA